ncbi:hypothetical protein PInf_007406 [Phytophthora infestans]|nr:hypothetical protein PInf_007406 [Phytophthora infestans]
MLDVTTVSSELTSASTLSDLAFFLDQFGSTHAIRLKFHEQQSEIRRLERQVKRVMNNENETAREETVCSVDSYQVGNDMEQATTDLAFFLKTFGSARAVRENLELQRHRIVGLQRTLQWFTDRQQGTQDNDKVALHRANTGTTLVAGMGNSHGNYQMCKVFGCKRKALVWYLCSEHRVNSKCATDGCDKLAATLGSSHCCRHTREQGLNDDRENQVIERCDKDEDDERGGDDSNGGNTSDTVSESSGDDDFLMSALQPEEDKSGDVAMVPLENQEDESIQFTTANSSREVSDYAELVARALRCANEAAAMFESAGEHSEQIERFVDTQSAAVQSDSTAFVTVMVATAFARSTTAAAQQSRRICVATME